MSGLSDIISKNVLHDLWGAGYTVLPRPRDPFDLPKALIPHGVSYQWNETPDREGWRPVPYSRHEGYFAPVGTQGDIEVSRLHLCERRTADIEAEHAKSHAKACQNVVDWAANTAQKFSGGINVNGLVVEIGDQAVGKAVRDDTFVTAGKTVETTVQVPMDMLPHMEAVFAERDRLKDEIVLPDRTLKPGKIADRFYAAVEADPGAPWWPTLLAILLPLAVDRVREQLSSQEKNNGPDDGRRGGNPEGAAAPGSGAQEDKASGGAGSVKAAGAGARGSAGTAQQPAPAVPPRIEPRSRKGDGAPRGRGRSRS